MTVRVVALVIVAALLLPMPIDAGKKHNHHRRENRPVMFVEDYTAPAWDGVIAETVADFNAVMPKRGPRLVYVRKPHVACAPAPTTTVCSGILGVGTAGLAYVTGGGGRIALNDLYAFPEDSAGFPALACHELMHILADVGDNYGAFPSASCVWGYLSDPGPKDVELLRARYGGDKDKKHDRRKKR
ncbi:MAG: hypothetical protein H0U59_06085 [Gemmatimonadaceae bacterium]|nr:hypothetical protein [Gemmatimonadaceae bacterium]